jgi:hypothetical protein
MHRQAPDLRRKIFVVGRNGSTFACDHVLRGVKAEGGCILVRAAVLAIVLRAHRVSSISQNHEMVPVGDALQACMINRLAGISDVTSAAGHEDCFAFKRQRVFLRMFCACTLGDGGHRSRADRKKSRCRGQHFGAGVRQSGVHRPENRLHRPSDTAIVM